MRPAASAAALLTQLADGRDVPSAGLPRTSSLPSGNPRVAPTQLHKPGQHRRVRAWPAGPRQASSPGRGLLKAGNRLASGRPETSYHHFADLVSRIPLATATRTVPRPAAGGCGHPREPHPPGLAPHRGPGTLGWVRTRPWMVVREPGWRQSLQVAMDRVPNASDRVRRPSAASGTRRRLLPSRVEHVEAAAWMARFPFRTRWNTLSTGGRSLHLVMPTAGLSPIEAVGFANRPASARPARPERSVSGEQVRYRWPLLGRRWAGGRCRRLALSRRRWSRRHPVPLGSGSELCGPGRRDPLRFAGVARPLQLVVPGLSRHGDAICRPATRCSGPRPRSWPPGGVGTVSPSCP